MRLAPQIESCVCVRNLDPCLSERFLDAFSTLSKHLSATAVVLEIPFAQFRARNGAD